MTLYLNEDGFTLIEILIVVIILAVLASIAVPSYSNFIRQGKLTDGTENLSRLSLQMEQQYQDNRTYRSPGLSTCAIANFTTTYFSFTCTSTASTNYVWTASVLSGVGMGAAADYVYSIDQNDNRLTLKFNGATYSPSISGWQYR